MNRLEKSVQDSLAAGRKQLVAYIVAGDPAPDWTIVAMHALVEAGVDVIELGVPFTDPEAEGPVIQGGHERALTHGVTLKKTLAMVQNFRERDDQTPVLLMGYLNPIEAMGLPEFAVAAKDVGVDGTIIVNLPPEESGELGPVFEQHGISPVFLLAPTTTDNRAKAVCDAARGFVYYVSLKGTTGSGKLDPVEVGNKVAHFKTMTDKAVYVGFGIKDAESARLVGSVADGVVMGSSLVDDMSRLAESVPVEEAHQHEALSPITNRMSAIRAALDQLSVSKLRSLSDWLDYIGQIHPVGWDLGLDRVNRVATALNVKHPAGTVILVAGTNGKGSCCEALNTLSMEAGLKTGLTTSPHIHHFSERIRVGGRPVEDEEIVAAFDHIEEARGETTLTYFEFASLAALVIFESNALDVAILEIGLGGRLDAMNVVDPDISVVLPIALDHQEYLGDSREQIGAEKAGILRPGQPAVVGDPDPPQSLVQAAQSASVVARYGKGSVGRVIDFGGPRMARSLKPSSTRPSCLPRACCSDANGCDAQLASHADKLPSLELLGRQSIVRIGGKTVLLDVAHNPHAVGRLKEKISEWRVSNPSADVLAVLGIYKDKAVDDIASLLAGVVTKFYCSEVAETRALSKDRLVDALHKKGLEAEALNTIGAALEEAMVRSEQNDLIVVFGSFPVVGEALNYFDHHPLE